MQLMCALTAGEALNAQDSEETTMTTAGKISAHMNTAKKTCH